MRRMTGKGALPTIDRRRLGALLRDWRDERRIKSKDAAAYIRVDATTLGRIERGLHGVGREKISALLELFEIDDPSALSELVRAATEDPTRQWWYPYRNLIAQAYLDLIALENRAISIQVATNGVPGLLQSMSHAQAMQEAIPVPWFNSRAAELATVRMGRQQVITRTQQSTRLEAVFSEAALVGGHATMGEQIEHLIAMSKRPNVSIQILPFSAPLAARSVQATQILEFSHPWKPVLHLDSPFGGLLDDSSESVNLAKDLFAFVRDNALPVDETREFMKDQLRKIEG